jgi:hypothetical protein
MATVQVYSKWPQHLHFMHWLMLELAWSDLQATDRDAIPDTVISYIDIVDGENSVSCSLLWCSPVFQFDPMHFCYYTCREFIAPPQSP